MTLFPYYPPGGKSIQIVHMTMNAHLRFRIVLEKPPAGVDFGVQKGRGSAYETIQTQRSVGSDLRFEFTIEARGTTKGSQPDFRGPFVQGRAGERFVYIDIGQFAGQAGTPWSRRMKIPLSGITSAMVQHASADARTVFEARVAGTGRDGSPACATVKPFDGWKTTSD
jgi:hypothetical protein